MRSRFAGGGNLPDDRNRALRLIARGELQARPFITHEFALEQAEEAFATAASGPHAKWSSVWKPREPDEADSEESSPTMAAIWTVLGPSIQQCSVGH